MELGLCRDGSRGLADGAHTPVDDLGLVDREPVIIGGFQARPAPHRAVDIDHATAGLADEVVVVVVDPILRLNQQILRPGVDRVRAMLDENAAPDPPPALLRGV